MKLHNIFILVGLIFTFESLATDQSDITFMDGSVLLVCTTKNEEELMSTKVFNSAFPHLIVKLQQYMDEGKLIRAHYLGQLKEGVFMVIGGETIDEALINATEIMTVTSKIIENAFSENDVSVSDRPQRSCQFMEVGPVALSKK